MNETLTQFLDLCQELAQSGCRRAVLATLSSTQKTGQPTGRRAWILPDGQLRGHVTLGGCADHRLRQLAQQVMQTGHALQTRLELGSGEAFEFGLTCSGQIDLHLGVADPGAPLWHWARTAQEQGQVLMLLTPLADLPPLGLTFGQHQEADGAVTLNPEAAHNPAFGLIQRQHLRQLALGLLHEQARPRATILNGQLQQAEPEQADPEQADDAQERAPSVATPDPYLSSFLCEIWPPAPRLLIVGTGPIALPLSRLGRTLGLRVIVTDDHAERLNASFLPDAHELLGVPAGHDLQLPPLGPADAVVVISHDYAHELSVLSRTLQDSAGYIGLVASRRRGQALLHFLQETGYTPAELSRIRTPAGLDLGLNTPAGIALSILSEVVQVFHQASGQRLSAPTLSLV